MPTVVDLAGATYPTDFNGHKILPEEGISMVPAFNSTQPLQDRTLFWEHEGNRAVNDGHYKLVALWNHPWELYDFVANRTEDKTQDLAAAHPDVVKKMSDEWDAWGKRVGAAEEYPPAPVFGTLKSMGTSAYGNQGSPGDSAEGPDN